jgi:hypothetical protein
MAVLKYWDPAAGDYVELLAPVSGTLILTGSSPPASGTGSQGNFYLDAAAHILYGPKDGPYWPLALDGSGGGGGGGAGVRTFEMTFATAANIWTIPHNFNTKIVEVNCYDPAGVDEYDVEADVIDANTVVVRWYYPTAGIARVMA